MVDLAKTSMERLWANQGDIVSPTDEKIEEGWGVEPVPRQWWNWMQNRVDNNIAYLLQKGFPEWDNQSEYIINKSYVQRQDRVYKCIKTNTGMDPLSSPTHWVKAFLSSSVALESIGALTPVANTFPYYTSSTAAALTALTPLARTLLAASTTVQMRTVLEAQASSAVLTALSQVAPGINSLPYFVGPASAAVTTLTAFARSLLDDDTPLAARTTLGLKTMATQDSTAVNITGGTISGITALPVPSGGTGASTVAGARTNLGLGTASVLDVVQNQSDSVAGRVLAVGYAGLGVKGLLIAAGADLNDYVNTGFYGQQANASAMSGTNYPVPLAGSLLVENAGGAITTQKYTVYSSGETYLRARYSDQWYPWRRVFDSGNVSTFVQWLLTAADAVAFRTAIGANDAGTLTVGAVPVARGGTGATAVTGSGRNVLNTSPEFVGTPTAPTAPAGTKSTQIATTAFVIDNSAANPVGTVIQSAGAVVPTGYLKCNGANVSRAAYPVLFNIIGTRYGAGDGSTTFTLPDLRGEFIRGWDDGRGVDPGRTLGTWQAGQNASHTHTASTASAGAHIHAASAAVDGVHQHVSPQGSWNGPSAVANTTYPWASGDDHTNIVTRLPQAMVDAAGSHTHAITVGSAGAHSHTVTVAATGGNESRPRNMALMFCIKF